MTARSSINQYQYRSNAESPIRKGNRNLDVNVSRLKTPPKSALLKDANTDYTLQKYKNTKIQVHKYTVHITKIQKHKCSVLHYKITQVHKCREPNRKRKSRCKCVKPPPRSALPEDRGDHPDRCSAPMHLYFYNKCANTNEITKI